MRLLSIGSRTRTSFGALAATAALLLATPAQAQTFAGYGGATTTVAPPSFSKSCSKTHSAGNTDWGGGFTAAGSLSAQGYSGARTFRSSGSVSAWARMAGRKVNVAEVRGNSYAREGGSSSDYNSVSAYVLGVEIWGQSLPATYVHERTWSYTFFSVDVPIPLGPIPVVASARASGGLGFKFSATLTPTYMHTLFSPRAWADALLQIGIGGPYLSFGLFNRFELIYARLPTYATLEVLASGDVGWALNSTLHFIHTRGTFGFYIECTPLLRWEHVIEQYFWMPTLTATLIDLSGSFDF